MESRLVPISAQTVKFGAVANHAEFHFCPRDGFRVERSHKYSLKQILDLCTKSGFQFVENFVHNGFCDSLWRKP